jgi:hypothetical protein
VDVLKASVMLVSEYFYNLFGFISEICECGPYHVIVVILVCIVAVLAGSCYVICISEIYVL